nr:hypothetical protein BaRGS_000686 [Batillaria attramentaria]
MAAQYGKKEVVRTLLTGRRELLAHEAGQPSPLHLAAFNGHLPIVRFLLDQGFPVNTRTDNGTALHEAATSCKLDVIKLLLDRGVDVWAKANNGMTAEDILKSINSKLTKDALTIISGHINSQRTPDSDGEQDVNDEEGKISKPQSLELDGSKKRESAGAEGDLPLSPSTYAQPPTPDCPPPSPSTAIQGIQQKINPQEKRKSKDMETITETNLLLASATTDCDASATPQTTDTAESADITPASSASQAEQRLSQGLEPVAEEKGGDDRGAKKKTESSPSGDSEVSGDNTVEVLGETVQMRRSVSAGDNPVDWESNVFAVTEGTFNETGIRMTVSVYM